MPVVSSLEMLFYYFPFTHNSVWHPAFLKDVNKTMNQGLEAKEESYAHLLLSGGMMSLSVHTRK